jgi:hypothetical protein
MRAKAGFLSYLIAIGGMSPGSPTVLEVVREAFDEMIPSRELKHKLCGERNLRLETKILRV